VKDRWGTSRIEAFSDGVFAIAITLLVLDIRIPPGEFSDLWQAIADAWPSYLAYATSFVTIGGIWMAHHGIFRRLEYANAQVMRLNLLLLMAVAFLPFPTRLVAEAIDRTDAQRAAVIFYGANLLVISALLSAVWGAAVRDRTLLRPGVDEQEVNEILARTAPSLGFYVAVILLAILAPQVAAFGYLVIAVVAVLRVKGDDDAKAAPA
jgi:uncharacterized membrane protein